MRRREKIESLMSITTCLVLRSCEEFTADLFLFFHLIFNLFLLLAGGQKVQNIQPFSKKDLEIRSLADRIRDINEILYLYPNVGKDEAFGKFYTGETLHVRHYVYMI